MLSPTGRRRYRGCPSLANAHFTVLLEHHTTRAISEIGIRSDWRNQRVSAQSSTLSTLAPARLQPGSRGRWSKFGCRAVGSLHVRRHGWSCADHRQAAREPLLVFRCRRQAAACLGERAFTRIHPSIRWRSRVSLTRWISSRAGTVVAGGNPGEAGMYQPTSDILPATSSRSSPAGVPRGNGWDRSAPLTSVEGEWYAGALAGRRVVCEAHAHCRPHGRAQRPASGPAVDKTPSPTATTCSWRRERPAAPSGRRSPISANTEPNFGERAASDIDWTVKIVVTAQPVQPDQLRR
jgi:hypothetical protein